jgi:hypothetical protein
MQNKDIQIIDSTMKQMRMIIESAKVTNEDELAGISNQIKQVRDAKKKLQELKEAFVGPAKQIIEEAKGKYDDKIKFCDTVARQLDEVAKTYMIDQENIRKEEEAKIAEKLEQGKIKTETAVKRMEKLPEAPKTINTGASKLQLKKRKVAEITEPNLVPKEYWVIDEVRVRKDALDREKNGLPQIPGVIIKEVVDMSH